jgi:hypothetical protein
MRRFEWLLAGPLLVSLGCRHEASVPPATPTAVAAGSHAPAAVPPSDPWAVPAAPREDDLATEPGVVSVGAWRDATKGIAAAPATCKEWAARAPVTSDLAGALSETDPAKRDAKLAGYAKSDPDKLAFATALRADLAPIECADAITDVAIGRMREPAPSPGGAIAEVLVGLSLASKLSRTAATPPTMGSASDKEKVKSFIKGPLATWMIAEAKTIEGLSSGARGLRGYGRGIAALEAGVADLRLVDKIRSAPTPSSWDAELKQVYEAALDEALEPRKRRGRDAALVGLGDFAREGIIDDPRVGHARQMLSKLYGGRRIDALDALMLPPTTTTHGPSAFWMNVSTDVPTDLGRGYPASARARTRRDPTSGTSAEARARLELGRRYWRKVDFVEAAQIARNLKEPSDRLVLAIALALAHGGAQSAADMMNARAPSQLALNDTAALDTLAAEGGPLAGMAAFDAAHLRSLSPPEHAPSAHLKDVAARFRRAAQLLSAEAKQIAEARAMDAEGAAKIAEETGAPRPAR